MDYIDLYYIYFFDDDILKDKVVVVFKEFKDEGKIKVIGVFNFFLE